MIETFSLIGTIAIAILIGPWIVKFYSQLAIELMAGKEES